MANDVIYSLINKDTDALCADFNILPFQADLLAFLYLNSDRMSYRNMIIEKLNRGDYLREEVVRNMAKTYCDKLFSHGGAYANYFLTNVCGYSEEQANEFIETYLRESRALDDMLSMEVDASNVNIRINDMMDDVINSFIESQKQKNL